MRRVGIGRQDVARLTESVLRSAPTTVGDALRLGVDLEPLSPLVGSGATVDLWEALATLASSDVALARAVEPHLDAVTILDQAGVHPAPSGPSTANVATWGVYAAEAPGARLEATELTGDGERSGWRLSGTKAWCSLAGTLSHALVTAWTSTTDRGLFAVDLRAPGVTVAEPLWVARGLREIPSGDVAFADVAAVPVGAPGWYLTRPGFAWGGMSVAACWFGGAVGVARPLLAAARQAAVPGDPVALMHLGVVDARLNEARLALRAAANDVDAGVSGSEAALLAKRVRATVARSVEAVLDHVGHALGPAPLAHDEQHAKRVDDLRLYVAQHHFERDDASLGRGVRDAAFDVEW